MSAGISPYSSGGGGTVLEHRYAAVLLASLLTGDSLEELGDPVLAPVSITLQASEFSKVDDIMIIGRPPSGGEDVRTFVGVRRDPDVVPSDDATVRLIGCYLQEVDEHWTEIQAGGYRLVLAVANRSAHANQLAQLTQVARTSGPEAFRAKASRSGPTNGKVRDRLAQLDKVVIKAAAGSGIDTSLVPPDELTWRLLSSLTVQHLRLEDGDERDRTQVVALVRRVAVEDTARAAEEVLSRIEHLAGTWAPIGAQVTKAMLTRELRARLKPRFSSLSAPPESVKVEPDALVRGPVAHLGLSQEFDRAKALETGNPARAAELYAQIADALDSSAWAPFAMALRQRQAEAHHRAGDHTRGVTADIAVLVDALSTGDVGRAMAVTYRLDRDQIAAPDELVRTVNALGDLAAFEHHHQVTLDEVTASIDALQASDPQVLMAVTWFAEHVIANGRADLLKPRAKDLSALAGAVVDRDLLWPARLRACLADADDTGTTWTALSRSARSDYPPSVTALLLARHARHLADTGHAERALERYDDAIERAVSSGYHQDAVAWAEARNLVRIRYGLDSSKISGAYPEATALRSAGRNSVLLTPFSSRERALGKVANTAHPAETLQALTQYLRHAVAAASWLEEHEAHELLGRFHLDHQQTVPAVHHLIAAGADKLLRTLATRMSEEPFHFPAPVRWDDQPPWRKHSVLTAVHAAADLITDDQASTWIELALTEIDNDQPVSFGTRNPRRAAFGVFAELADATTVDQAQRFLDLTQPLIDNPTHRELATGQAHAGALIRIALRHPGRLQYVAVDRMCQAMLSDAFMANVVLAAGQEALRLQPEAVAERCAAAAGAGNADAALALILADAPADCARPLAETALNQLLHGHDGSDPPTSASLTPSALLIGHLLRPVDREACSSAIINRIQSHHYTAQQRQDALSALSILAAYLSPEQRTYPLAVAMQAARGELDGSAHDDINMSHVYDRSQLNMGPLTLRYHGVSAAAHLAGTPSAKQQIIELALPLLAQPEEGSEPLITKALVQLLSDQHTPPLPMLAGHSSPWIRGLAARLWCTSGNQPVSNNLGLHFASDPSPRVRGTLARNLPDTDDYAHLRNILRHDCRRSVRTMIGL